MIDRANRWANIYYMSFITRTHPQTLKAFTAEVNRRNSLECERLNDEKNRLFKAVHHEVGEGFCSFYFNNGYSVRKTIQEMSVPSI